MNVAQLVLDRSKVILFVALVVAACGVRSYVIAPQSIFPAMSFARVDVVADAGDLTPERVRIAVTKPLETAFGTLPAATRVRATSTQGSADILIDFDTRTDPRADLQTVLAAISSLAPGLPSAKRIDAVIVNPNAEPVLSYGLTSRVLSQAALRTFVTTRIVPVFAGTPGLGRTSVVGGPPIEYRVELAPAALAVAGLSAADVANAIGDASNVTSVGTAVRYHQRYVLLVDASIHDARTLATIAIPLKAGGAVPLGTLGSVRLGVGVAVNEAAVNGVHAVVLNAFALAGADVVSLAGAFGARLDAIRGALPADMAIVPYWDQTRLIVDSQHSLRDAIMLGALLAIVVIFVFLRSIRLTLVAAAIIPLALAITVLALEGTGQSLNLMSVGGLAVAVGLIIDDIIVVIEAIARGIAENPTAPRTSVIAEAVGSIAGAMTASTLTTVVVFIPLGLLSGVAGFFFRALAFTLATSLLVSLALAIGVAPLIAQGLLRKTSPRQTRTDRLQATYEPILRWALTHRFAMLGGAAVVLATTVLLLSQLPSDFLPKLDEGEFEVKYTLPAGATLADSDAAASTLERVILHDPTVNSVGRLSGIDTNGFSPTQANTGTLRIALRPSGRPGYEVISARLRDALSTAVPAANLDFHQLLEDQIDDLSGTPQPVEITLSGPDQRRLIDLADTTTDAIANVHGVVDVFDGVVDDDLSLAVVPLGARLAARGLTTGDLGDAVSAGTQGIIAAQLPAQGLTIPVNVRVAGAPGAPHVEDVSLFTRGGPTALRAVARIDRPARASDINEENGRLVDRVTANVEGASLSVVVAGLETALEHVNFPPGYSALIGGAYETEQASFREFAGVIAIAIVLVFSVVLGTFGSFRLPLVILCAIPLALIGVAAALFVTRTPLDVSSCMGLLLLVGIVVKNGILLIDVARRRRAAGDDVTAALVRAGSTRVRPIVMTTLAAIGGLLPLALGLGPGAEMERPLAIAVIGGLSTATAFTLVLIPLLYATFYGRGARRSPVWAAVIWLIALALVGPHAVNAQTTLAAQNLAAPVRRFAQVDVAAAQELAIIASPEVHLARAAIDGAQAALALARATNGFSLVGGYSEAPQGAPGGAIAQRLTTYGGQVTLGDLTALGPLVAQADAAMRAARTDEAAAERSERIKVTSLYYGALKARAVYGARVSAVDSARRQLEAAQQRFAAGDAPRIDSVRAQVALARAQGDLAQASAAEGSATDALAREVDRPPDVFDVTEPDVTSVAADGLPAPQAAVASALAQRSDLRSADSVVRASAAGVAAARGGVLPALTLGAGYARGIDSGFPANGPTISAALSIPLGGSVAARVHAQGALLDAARARREIVTRAIALDVGAAARSAAASVDVEAAALSALTAAQTELDSATLGYARGAATSLDISIARTTYVQAAVDALAAGYDRLAARAILALEIGS